MYNGSDDGWITTALLVPRPRLAPRVLFLDRGRWDGRDEAGQVWWSIMVPERQADEGSTLGATARVTEARRPVIRPRGVTMPRA